MSSSPALLLPFLIGAVAGLRSMMAPAVVAWAAQRSWLDLRDSPLSFMGSAAAVAIFTVLAVGELVVDKLPSTPSRLQPAGLIARAVIGGLSGATVAAAGLHSIALGAVFGAAGGIAGAFAGHAARTRLTRALGVRDFVVALLEDVVALGGGLLIVSRF